MRRVRGRVYGTPCAIRRVIADRARAKVQVDLDLPNDELEALFIASERSPLLRQLYLRLIGATP